MKRGATALAVAESAARTLPHELVQQIFMAAPSRAFLLVCRHWGEAVEALKPDWHSLLRSKMGFSVCTERVESCQIRFGVSPAFKNDLACLEDSINAQAVMDDGEVGWQCRRILLTYVSESCSELMMHNYHPRDMRACFVDTPEEPHRYYLMHFERDHYRILSNDPASAEPLLSVTTFIHTLFPPFDEPRMIAAVRASPRHQRPDSRYYGLTTEEIAKAWEAARTNGTTNHASIEHHYNSMHSPPADARAWKLFEEFERRYITGKLQPYRTEWTVYSQPLRLIGQVDMLYQSVDPAQQRDAQGRLRLVMYDWKFCYSIEQASYNGASGLAACTYNVPDCNFGHYGIQLHLYKYLLELHYDVVIDSMSLGVFHPEQAEPLVMPIPYDERLIRRVIAHRRAMLARRETVVQPLPMAGVEAVVQ